jgi:hypothetical protein
MVSGHSNGHLLLQQQHQNHINQNNQFANNGLNSNASHMAQFNVPKGVHDPNL